MKSKFSPSLITEQIYNILDNYIVGSDSYDIEAIPTIANYLEALPHIQYTMEQIAYPDMTGGTAIFAWAEENHPHMVIFDYEYS